MTANSKKKKPNMLYYVFMFYGLEGVFNETVSYSVNYISIKLKVFTIYILHSAESLDHAHNLESIIHDLMHYCIFVQKFEVLRKYLLDWLNDLTCQINLQDVPEW